MIHTGTVFKSVVSGDHRLWANLSFIVKAIADLFLGM